MIHRIFFAGALTSNYRADCTAPYLVKGKLGADCFQRTSPCLFGALPPKGFMVLGTLKEDIPKAFTNVLFSIKSHVAQFVDKQSWSNAVHIGNGKYLIAEHGYVYSGAKNYLGSSTKNNKSPDFSCWENSLKKSSTGNDLAVVHIPHTQTPAVTLCQKPLKENEQLYIIGYWKTKKSPVILPVKYTGKTDKILETNILYNEAGREYGIVYSDWIGSEKGSVEGLSGSPIVNANGNMVGLLIKQIADPNNVDSYTGSLVMRPARVIQEFING